MSDPRLLRRCLLASAWLPHVNELNFVFCSCIVLSISGCCAFGEECPVVCNAGDAAVAGCVFPPPTEPPTESPSTEPSLLPTDVPSAQPSNPPTLLPSSEPSISPTEFPSTEPTAAPFTIHPTIDFSGQCQVQVNTDKCSNYIPAQPAVEGCDCYNYCGGFPIACCKFGEKCPPLDCTGNSLFVAGCELDDTPSSTPSSLPTPIREECPVSVSGEKCPTLMPTITTTPACDCYNFCNGQEIQCCPFDTGCPLSCSGEFVAGCREDTPTPAPEVTESNTCLTAINTELCPLFTVGQEPMEDCDCYNYCNGKP